MRLRDKLKFYKQRRICKKNHRCIETIKKYEPTIDGSFFSPVQLRALSQLHLLCDEIDYPKAAFVSNYALEIHENYREALKKVLRLEGHRYKTATCCQLTDEELVLMKACRHKSSCEEPYFKDFQHVDAEMGEEREIVPKDNEVQE